MKLKEKIKQAQKDLRRGLVERDNAVNLALLAALAGEHILFIGPPGTAKSELARRIHKAFEGEYFERLLTKFSVPEELFGPLSIKGLENDRYERKTDRYLPKASVAFLDEIFKANSAILNALLTLLNERKFDNGTKQEDTHLVSVIGASNELPEDGELNALYDRFLFRMHIDPVSDDGFWALLDTGGAASNDMFVKEKFSETELYAIREGASKAEVPDKVLALLKNMRDSAMEQGIRVSDRRWRKIVGMLQVAAYCNDRKKVTVWDCWLLQFCLWNKPEERKAILAHYEEYAQAGGIDVSALRKLVASKKRDVEKRHLIEETGEWGSRPKQFPPKSIQDFVGEMQKILDDLEKQRLSLDQRVRSLKQEIEGNLWVDSAFADSAIKNMESSIETFNTLIGEANEVKDSYAELPREEMDDDDEEDASE